MKSPLNLYVNELTREVSTEAEVRAFHKNISVSDEDFPLPPHYPVLRGPYPEYNPITQVLVPIEPRHVDGRWETRYRVDDLPDAEQRMADAKATMRERINARRDQLQTNGGALVGGKWFLSNDREVGRYNSIITLATAMGLPGSAVIRAAWRTMEPGVTANMTADLARQIMVAGFAQFAAIDDAAQAHKAAMEASDRPDLYDFKSGWPATYEG
jgi:hypothetical protein